MKQWANVIRALSPSGSDKKFLSSQNLGVWYPNISFYKNLNGKIISREVSFFILDTLNRFW